MQIINDFAIMKFDNLRVVAKVCSGKVLTDLVSVAGVAGVAYLQESKQVWLELEMFCFAFQHQTLDGTRHHFLQDF